jgi:glycerol-3-phosphate dehydrogenase subunit C
VASESQPRLGRNPAVPPAVHPDDPRYWDPVDLEAETRRVFQICSDCRMCVGYCGTFPSVFAAVDRDVDAGRADGTEALSTSDMRRATDLCWQCKLCYIKCPYTADEGAAELVDFPRLMAREKAQRTKDEGLPLVDRVLGEPGVLGRLGSGMHAPLANFVNRNHLLRKLGQTLAGVSAEFPLPAFASESFPSWLERHRPAPGAGTAGEVVLFSTCTGDYNETSIPKAAVRVLEHQGFRVLRPEGQVCCGMPNLDGGAVDAMRAKVDANVALLAPLVAQGKTIVVPAPTCGYTMKKEWPLYSSRPETAMVARATVDAMEFLDRLRKQKTLKTDFKQPLGAIAYHAACHLRAQKIATPGQRVLALVPGADVRLVEQCSAVDGTWGMKAEHYELGRKYAQKLVRGIRDTEAPRVVTDCALAGLRIKKENQLDVLHPLEALSQAYGLDEGAGDGVGAGAKSQVAP